MIAALVTLGFAAVGVVAAQKATLSSPPELPPTERVARAANPAQARAAPPTPVASPVRDTDAFASTTIHARRTARAGVNHGGTVAATCSRRAAAPRREYGPADARGNRDRPRRSLRPGRRYRRLRQAGQHGPARIVEIDTTGGPGFGFEHFKQYDFLRAGEVCTDLRRRSVAREHPRRAQGTLRQLSQGDVLRDRPARDVAPKSPSRWRRPATRRHPHLVAKDLSKSPYAGDIEQAKQEIEMGISAVHAAVAGRSRRSSASPRSSIRPSC